MFARRCVLACARCYFCKFGRSWAGFWTRRHSACVEWPPCPKSLRVQTCPKCRVQTCPTVSKRVQKELPCPNVFRAYRIRVQTSSKRHRVQTCPKSLPNVCKRVQSVSKACPNVSKRVQTCANVSKRVQNRRVQTCPKYSFLFP